MAAPRRRWQRRSTAPAASRASSTSSAMASIPPALRRLERLSRTLLRARARGEDEDPHGTRRARLARLLPGRRRADVGPARSEGGSLLRRRARRRRIPTVRAGTPLHGHNLFPERPPELRSAVLDHLDRDDATRSPPDGRHRARARTRARLLRRTLHRRPADPLPHLPLPRATRGRRVREPVERRRAHRLRTPHHPDAGRHRRARGEVASAAGSKRRRSRARSSATSATCSTG